MGPPNISSAYNGTFRRASTNKRRQCVCFKADLGDVPQEQFGGLDAPEAHHDAGTPARLRELHAGGVHPNPLATHVLRAPLARAGVPLYSAACNERVLDRLPRQRDACNTGVQRGEQERREQLGFGLARIRVWRKCDQPCGLERGEEVSAQDGDVADRRSGDVVLGAHGDSEKCLIKMKERRTSVQNARIALGDSSRCIRMHSS
jgi:hypothetical protein